MSDSLLPDTLEASKGGMKVGRIKDPLYKDSYLGIIPPTFIPPLEPFEQSGAPTWRLSGSSHAPSTFGRRAPGKQQNGSCSRCGPAFLHRRLAMLCIRHHPLASSAGKSFLVVVLPKIRAIGAGDGGLLGWISSFSHHPLYDPEVRVEIFRRNAG